MQKIFHALAIAIFTFSFSHVSSQSSLPTVSPEALAYGKYADIPVSEHTGTANVTVPISTVSSGSLTLPIFLQYHTAGLQVGTPASSVGLGWNLSAGGMISRTIRGLSDDIANKGYYFQGHQIIYPTNQNSLVWELDSEPDVFTYNFPGYSGKFFFDKNKVAHTVPKTDLKISVLAPTSANGFYAFQQFKIITPEGVIYTFGCSDDKTTKAYDYVAFQREVYNASDINGWHLISIESPDFKDRITLTYQLVSYSYETPSLCDEEVKYRKSSGGTVYTENKCDGNLTQNFKVKSVLPLTITSDFQNVAFTLDPRSDLLPYTTSYGPANKISGLLVVDGKHSSRWKFTQSYFKDAASSSAAKRLKLDAVQRQDFTGTAVEPAWRFNYSGTTNADTEKSIFFPSTKDKNIDHWGYYNRVTGGANNNSFNNITPRTGISIYNAVTYYGDANRESNEAAMLQGMLDRVTYPTGGYLDLDYEANRYWKDGAVTTALDLTSCDYSICPDYDELESNFTYTTEMASTGRWNFSVTPNSNTTAGQGSGKVEVRTTSGTLVSSIEFNSLASLEGALPKIGLKSTDQPMVAGQTYRIKITATRAAVSLKIIYTKNATDAICGGLRIKQTRINDGSKNSSGQPVTTNDIIKTYRYQSKTNSAVSSGILYRKPEYGFKLNTYSAVFVAYSLTPLSNFNGYHIGYGRVVVDYNGIGEQELLFGLENLTSSSSAFPAKPANFSIIDGVLKESHQYAEGSTTPVASTTISQYSSDGYQTFGESSATGYIYAARKLKVHDGGSGAKEINFWNKYSIRTGVFRPGKIVSQVDGITTVNTYAYGATVLLPKDVVSTNSSGTESVTNTTYYSGEHPDPKLREKFTKYNILYLPFKNQIRVNNVLVDASETTFRFYSTSGLSPSTDYAGKLDVPRIYQQTQIEKSYNSSGSLTGSDDYKVLSTILEYTSDGRPALSQEDGWSTTRVVYNSKKLPTSKIFRSHQEDYEYEGNRLSIVTAQDGTTTSYKYDIIGRLQTVTDDCNNIVTTYTYHFTTGGSDKNYTEVKVDFPEPSSNSALDIVETRTYLDGLGRPIQTVAKKQGPSATQDIITAQTYDKYGRVFRTFEPYASDNNGGAYKAPSTSWGYTQTTFVNSPLNRVLTVTPPSWSATTYSYGTNTSDDAVKILTSVNVNYDASTLTKLIVQDGNGNKLITFTDKFGRKVLSRRTTSTDPSSARLDTYYLYDGKGRLSKVLPPGASTSSTKLIYTYLYDGKNQLIEKTIPGKDKEEFRYNSQQLLAASRDGELRDDSKWYVYNYDSYGRELKSGFYGNTLPSDLTAIAPTEVLTEIAYGTQSYDWDKIASIKAKVLGSTSDFITTTSIYTSCGRLKEQKGNNHLLLSPANGELTTYTYDGAGNVVGSTYTHKAPSQTHTITSASFLDHAGRTISDDFKVDAGTNRKVHQFTYDQKGNVVTKYQGGTGKSGALAYLQKIDYSYLANGLLQGININTSTGKLSGSQVGLPANGAAATAPSPATPSSTSYDDRDLFYLELYRNQAATGISTSSFPTRANGDIVAVATQVRGRKQQLWAMTYDSYDRMRNTTFYQRDSRTATPTVYANYNEDVAGSAYDTRGNIVNLNRSDSYVTSGKYYSAAIDNLIYNYETSTNRLSRIDDFTDDVRGYPGGSGSYTYDQNGNVTYDPARKVTLVYNHLNLPERITWADGRKMEMTYDAGGTLLSRRTVGANTVTVEERHYIGGIEYVKSGTSYKLEIIHHSEGRILFSGTTQEWQYALTDHLGNTRLVYADRNGDGIVAVPSEIVQEEHYFPFGMKMTGPWMGGAAGARTKYQYNGIEYVDAFALNVNMATYRTLDPTIGRWWGVDPKAELQRSLSPYNAMNNSPLLYNDPNGDIAPLVALGLIAGAGGLLNLGSAALSGKVNSVGSALGYFTTGAVGAATAVTNPGAGYALTVTGNLATDALSGNLPEASDSGLSKGLYAGSLLLSGFNATGAVSIVGAVSPITLQAARVAFSSSYIQVVSEAGKALAYVGSKDAAYEALKAATGGGAKTVVNASALEKIANSTYITSKGVSTGLTHAGRAVTKHPEIFGFKNAELLRQVYRSDAALNELGLKGIQNILQNGRFGIEFAQKAGGYAIAFRLPNGAGARWSLTGEWIGFLKP